jgi:hypothetical protein
VVYVLAAAAAAVDVVAVAALLRQLLSELTLFIVVCNVNTIQAGRLCVSVRL